MDRQIYASDWKVLERLWDESPQTLMQLVHTLSEEVGWSKSTVATMVKRMEAKGLLRFEESAKARKIYPTLTREEASASETHTLIDKVFKGSPGLLMASLLEQNEFTQAEIDELYAMLRKAEEGRHA